jgi:DNA adenine methylase
MKPLLKWAGGKSRLASEICDAFGAPCTRTYFEPFVGSASVFLHRRAAGRIHGKAVLSDLNPKLVAFHVAVRDDVDGVILALERLPRGDDWRERYYEVREAFNRGPHEGADHAARFCWLNRAGFNGLYRENRRGMFNVPIGSYAKLQLPEPALFWRISGLLKDVEITTSGFGEVLSRASDGDQVYCDPPYVPLSATANFVGYASEPFGHTEQKKLADIAWECATRGARVVLSNHDLPIVRDELYTLSRGFEMVGAPQVNRAISRDAAHRGSVAEVIAAIGPVRPLAA